MLHIHPNARTTPVTRAEIARSEEPSSVLARRYGVSTETVRKWRKRGAADCLDRSARPHHLCRRRPARHGLARAQRGSAPSCLVAEHCWDPVRLAIVEQAWRFKRLTAAPGQG